MLWFLEPMAGCLCVVTWCTSFLGLLAAYLSAKDRHQLAYLRFSRGAPPALFFGSFLRPLLGRCWMSVTRNSALCPRGPCFFFFFSSPPPVVPRAAETFLAKKKRPNIFRGVPRRMRAPRNAEPKTIRPDEKSISATGGCGCLFCLSFFFFYFFAFFPSLTNIRMEKRRGFHFAVLGSRRKRARLSSKGWPGAARVRCFFLSMDRSLDIFACPPPPRGHLPGPLVMARRFVFASPESPSRGSHTVKMASPARMAFSPRRRVNEIRSGPCGQREKSGRVFDARRWDAACIELCDRSRSVDILAKITWCPGLGRHKAPYYTYVPTTETKYAQRDILLPKDELRWTQTPSV